MPNDNEKRELLHGLTAEQAAQVTALGEKVSVASGKVLFPLGAEADRLYLVQSGRISLTLPLAIRGETKEVFLEEKGRGEMVGWSALVPPYRFTLAAHANVDSELLGLSRTKVQELFARDPAIGFVVTNNLATMIGQRLQKLQAMWLREVQRVVDAKFGVR